MLLDKQTIKNILKDSSITINGVLHVGAHDCEELSFYTEYLNVQKDSVVWIDAVISKVELGKQNGNNIYHATITDKDDEDITFNVSNNVQSSSIFEFKRHALLYPEVVYVDKIVQKTLTIDTFFSRNNLNPEKCDFWNFDIQGAELLALKGATEAIKFAKAIYLEVNEQEIYTNGDLVNEIDDFLIKYNFKRVITNDMSSSGWGDALYTRTN